MTGRGATSRRRSPALPTDMGSVTVAIATMDPTAKTLPSHNGPPMKYDPLAKVTMISADGADVTNTSVRLDLAQTGRRGIPENLIKCVLFKYGLYIGRNVLQDQ